MKSVLWVVLLFPTLTFAQGGAGGGGAAGGGVGGVAGGGHGADGSPQEMCPPIQRPSREDSETYPPGPDAVAGDLEGRVSKELQRLRTAELLEYRGEEAAISREHPAGSFEFYEAMGLHYMADKFKHLSPEWHKAVGAFTSALEVSWAHPRAAQVRLLRGICRSESHQYADAVTDLEATFAQMTNPLRDRALSELEESLIALGRFTEADRYLKQFANSVPGLSVQWQHSVKNQYKIRNDLAAEEGFHLYCEYRPAECESLRREVAALMPARIATAGSMIQLERDIVTANRVGTNAGAIEVSRFVALSRFSSPGLVVDTFEGLSAEAQASAACQQGLARALIALEKMDEAHAILSRLSASTQSKDPELYYLRGTVFAAKGLLMEAADAFTTAIENDFDPIAKIFKARSDVLLGLYREDLACQDYASVCRVDPTSPDGDVGQALCYALRGDYDSAQAHLTAAAVMAKGAGAVERLFNDSYDRYRVLRPQGRVLATAVSNGEFKLRPMDAEAAAARGSFVMANGDVASAINYFSSALRQDPENANLYWLRSQANRKMGNLQSALEDLDQYWSLFNESRSSAEQLIAYSFQRGNLLFQLHNLVEARRSLERTIELARVSGPSAQSGQVGANMIAPSLIMLGIIEFASGNNADAYARWSSAFTSDPSLCVDATRQASSDDSESSVGKAARAFKRWVGAKLNFDHATGDLAAHEAESLLRQCVASVPDFPQAQQMLVRALVLKGDYTNARTMIEKLTSDPSDSEFALLRWATVAIGESQETANQGLMTVTAFSNPEDQLIQSFLLSKINVLQFMAEANKAKFEIKASFFLALRSLTASSTVDPSNAKETLRKVVAGTPVTIEDRFYQKWASSLLALF